jgi:hypothetical protein
MNRYALQWLVPREPDRHTHVMLLDRQRPAPSVLAVGHGANKEHALLGLWQALIEDGGSAQAVDYVADQYRRHGGMAPLTS